MGTNGYKWYTQPPAGPLYCFQKNIIGHSKQWLSGLINWKMFTKWIILDHFSDIRMVRWDCGGLHHGPCKRHGFLLGVLALWGISGVTVWLTRTMIMWQQEGFISSCPENMRSLLKMHRSIGGNVLDTLNVYNPCDLLEATDCGFIVW